MWKGGDRLNTEFRDLPELMVRYRAKHNLTQDELARRCNLTKATVNAIEAGKRAGITKLTRAKILNAIESEEF